MCQSLLTADASGMLWFVSPSTGGPYKNQLHLRHYRLCINYIGDILAVLYSEYGHIMDIQVFN